MPPGWLTLTQAAAQLGIQAQTLKIQAQHGRLRAEKVGRDWLVSPAEVSRYRAEHLGKRGRRVSAASQSQAVRSQGAESQPVMVRPVPKPRKR